ncbi:unnamed protein product [Sphagnum jensenii]|uniref:50S ribosomal protein L35 n=1 Tax=Sphagnum jensenii TaxID=128206 RepID=A0ABP0V812_9BRYO
MACRQLPRLFLLRPLLLGRSQFPLLKSSFVASNMVHPGLVMKNPSGVGPSLPPGRMGFSSIMSVYPWSSKLLLTRTQLETPSHLQQECTRVAPSMLQGRVLAIVLLRSNSTGCRSYKKRFRALANGLYKRWRSGKRHNAHSKTNKQKRQLRRPSVAPHALATVMKKLNFLG